ncbi:MAG: hypothetical protein GEU73_11145 [Chloroflexi bacterium]|nr:hypothetical protein [Chloroflexota bacterium]
MSYRGNGHANPGDLWGRDPGDVPEPVNEGLAEGMDLFQTKRVGPVWRLPERSAVPMTITGMQDLSEAVAEAFAPIVAASDRWAEAIAPVMSQLRRRKEGNA